MSEIVWQDPPPKSRGPGRPIDQRRVEMDANPGRWLKWDEGAPSAAGMTRLKAAGYETTTRRIDGLYDLYARRPEGWTA